MRLCAGSVLLIICALLPPSHTLLTTIYNMPPCRRLLDKSAFIMFPQVNFWLNSILLPWTHLQSFLHREHSHIDGEAQQSYRMPAEWSPHRRTLMAWPDRISVDHNEQLRRARTEVANIAETIAHYEPVWLYTSAANAESAHSWITSENVTIKELEADMFWMRDVGPVFTESEDGKLVGIDTNFKTWGPRLSNSKQYDATLASRILHDQDIARVQAPFTLEGRALEVDGKGTLLVTESSILNPNRNPTLTTQMMDRHFQSPLGIKKTIWLSGVAGLEITDTHVDLLARFAPNNTVILSRPNAAVPEEEQTWRVFRQAKEVLRLSTTAVNRQLRVVEIEEAPTVPYARIADSRQRLTTSYVNYYLPNGAVVVPQFGNEGTDEEALRVLKEVWPDREVVGVKLDILPCMGGGVHRATLQWPHLASDVAGGAEGREDEL